MIQVDLTKAQEISHVLRRADRDNKMKELDIQATIPLLSEEAEAQRQIIRDANAVIQTAIDSATDEVELKQILVDNELI